MQRIGFLRASYTGAEGFWVSGFTLNSLSGFYGEFVSSLLRVHG